MARLARRHSLDVVWRLPARGRPVMACGAARTDAGVIERRCGERHRVLVTSLARSAGGDMCRCLTLGVIAVVTADAGAGRFLVIVARLFPASSRMASFAAIAGWHVGVGLAGGQRTVVAGATFLWRAFEPSADVARRAICSAVCAEQWKAGLGMIEGATSRLSLGWT